MSELTKALRDGVKDFIPEVGQRLRDDYFARISEERQCEREENIAIAAMSLLDAGVEDKVVEQMLQKHWDLRLSEARSFIEWAKDQLSKTA